MAQRTLYTIGHSTHPWDEFVEMLKAWKIQVLVDVRTVPKSRAFPQFVIDHMAKALPRAGIRYVHFPALGGLRHAKRDSPNVGWQNSSFRGFADYMGQDGFRDGLAELDRLRAKSRTCIMCSEAVWWRCHRRMIADAEVARGVPVQHIMSRTAAKRHELTEFAVVKKRRGSSPQISYPAVAAQP